jgi:hypothetical protein
VFPDPAPPEDGAQESLLGRLKVAAERDRWACGEILRRSPRCHGSAGTLWCAYNAVTEYVDHWRPAASQGHSLASPLARIWFGDGYRRKVRAYVEAVRMCAN